MKKLTAEQRFKELIIGCVSKVDLKEYPNLIFYFKNDKIMFSLYMKTDIFGLSYDNIWSVFETEYDLNDQQIRDLTRNMFEEHLKCKVVLTQAVSDEITIKLEDHFKLNHKN